MRFDIQKFARRSCASLVVLCAAVASAAAVDRVQIQDGRSEAYLPYKIEKHYEAGYEGDRVPIAYRTQVYRVGHGSSPVAAYVTSYNRLYSEDMPSDISIWVYPKLDYLDEFAIDLKISDYTFYRDRRSGLRGIVGGGYRHDTSFAFLLIPKSGDKPIYIPLATGRDSTGDGEWRGLVFFLAVTDYDSDGGDEVFLSIDPARDSYPRSLVCFDPNERKVRWSLPMSAYLSRGAVISCNDSLHPGVLLAAYGSGGGRRDSVFASNYGYLAEVDHNGIVLNRKIVAGFGEPVSIVASPSDTFMFLIHTLPFTDQPDEVDTSLSGTYLTKITRHGVPVATITRPGRERVPWFLDYNRDGIPELFTLSYDGTVSIYDQNLHLIAESQATSIRGYVATFPGWADKDTVMLLSSGRGAEVYSRDFRKLAVIPGNWGAIEPLAYDSTGRLIAICATDNRNFLIANIQKRTLIELASVAYLDYQIYILSALFSLAVGLIVMNLFRRRISHQRRALTVSNQELAAAHAALQKAQATIIAQEKFRQARDIAGAFAHEIRNALFPADSALTKMVQLRRAPEADAERIDRLQETVRTAVSRAVSITEEIAVYTKLDTEYAPENVSVKQVVEELVHSHSELLAEKGVNFSVNGPDDCTVQSNRRQLWRVLTNLLMNSLDAIAGRPGPVVSIQWRNDGNRVILLFTDNGCGISEEHLGRVFDAFFSTKPAHGTGIGLAMSKKIIEMYGGTITVSSQINSGTTFTLTMELFGIPS